ncbi:hypothetical protein GQ42DRAFT_163531 [Ramicandelaber brevisporus]|nr:hypothetical protein GQ42DRAFT_163531 [Ramicandelaber brevisporus]
MTKNVYSPAHAASFLTISPRASSDVAPFAANCERCRRTSISSVTSGRSATAATDIKNAPRRLVAKIADVFSRN